LWTQWRLPLDLYAHRPKPDVFFSPTHYAPRFSPVPTVVSVMDLSFLYFPELFNKADLYQLRSWTEYSVKQAARVLTISNSSRNDIIKEYKVPAEKVVTIYPGIKETLSLEAHVYGMNQLKAKYHISDNYILFVGTLQPRKNIVRLIKAFSKVLKSKVESHKANDLQLIIVGKKGWLYEDILAAPYKYGVTESVKFLEGVTDAELGLFYKHAQCYVLPSLYEGFGLPVLEAMKYDCPVITSNVSSLPEAGGDAALYVDPENVDDIAAKIKHLISNETLRKELIAKGRKQVAKFSWEKTAKETLEVLEQVAKK
jgi:glycosyltransferase involved in cell wall biosynthesis